MYHSAILSSCNCTLLWTFDSNSLLGNGDAWPSNPARKLHSWIYESINYQSAMALVAVEDIMNLLTTMKPLICLWHPSGLQPLEHAMNFL